MEPKVRGIVAYVTLIGWIVAVVMNNPKDEFASFHIRQMLGLMATSFAVAVANFPLMFIPILGWILILVGWVIQIAIIGLWIFAFIGAVQGQQKEVPILGPYFQTWFQAL
jgi:uncharacterized membrane protein